MTPTTRIITLYTFDELPDEDAKAQARSWWRSLPLDHEWWDFVFEDFARVCAVLGVTLDSERSIWFTGFASQGDGASYAGSYAYARNSRKAIRAYAPDDARLHAIADAFAAVQKRNFYQLTATITAGRSRYCHEGTMRISVRRDGTDATSDAEDDLSEALCDLARWLYRQLEREYEYLMSDEQVDDTLRANEYTFTADGERMD